MMTRIEKSINGELVTDKKNEVIFISFEIILLLCQVSQ